ncbi:hypothetical protein SDC9_121267 [bioreactor metagenome]|uniref:Fluoroquinolones export permease protein n=1 Tax=bioreactor metagenome TaxID=1076179 RepID=A0A645CBH3_9ZZZZ|nr:ABC transporter permease [Candidatus Metalachnospira sp.]
MRIVWRSFIHMLRFIRHDMMQIVALVSIFLCGAVFKFGVPALETYLMGYFSKAYILKPYYGLFDILFSIISPTMLCYIASMVILEEKDDHVSVYLAATPLGKNGYILSRLVIPAVISFVLTLILLPFFSLSEVSFSTVIMLSLTGAAQGLIITLIVVVFSANKLEGLAVTKLSVIMMLAIFVPYFIRTNAQYLLCVLPTYWIGKAVHESSYMYFAFALVISALWIAVLEHKYELKSN